VRQKEFSRTRLSQSFFMRDFLFSEIAAVEGLSNLPDDPDPNVAFRLCIGTQIQDLGPALSANSYLEMREMCLGSACTN
jgi:hypothetical protein